MRLYAIRPGDVIAALDTASSKGQDNRGNPRFVGTDQQGRRIVVVIARDDPGYVITTFTESD